MWITQTYLTSPEPDAPLHIYYLYEDYKENHVNATKRIQEELERLSSTYPNVCILMPNPSSADRIEGELKRNQEIWQRLSGSLPAIVVSRKPIEKLDQSDDLFFVPLNHGGFSEPNMGLPPNSLRFAQTIQKLRILVGNDLSWQHRQLGKYEASPPGLLVNILDAVEMKPGILGFKVDLKKLWSLKR